MASQTVARTQLRLKAREDLAAAKGFDSLEKFQEHLKSCPDEEKAALLVEMNALATKAVGDEQAKPARSGKSMWKRAKLIIPFASA